MALPLVVVHGPPAAGKTTVARELAARLRCRSSPRTRSRRRSSTNSAPATSRGRGGSATFGVMLALVEESVAAGGSLVVEANFVRGSEAEARLAALPARIVQVYCSAPLELRLERYAGRERHPGHVDAERIEALREAEETKRHEPLDLPGETIRLNASRPVAVAALAERLAGSTA